jgi:hypothetical protein
MGKNKSAADSAPAATAADRDRDANANANADAAPIITDPAAIAARIAEAAAAAKAPRPKRSCIGFLWAACIALLGAAFTGNLLLNGLEQAMFSSPTVSMRGVDFIQFRCVCTARHIAHSGTVQ